MNVVVTGGGTIAPIDDVRLLTNVSSGRFAAAITEAFLDRGAAVWHIHAPTAQLPLSRFARFAFEEGDPSAEIDRLLLLRQRWLGVHDRLALLPLADGTVDDYARILKGVLQAQSIDVAVLAMAVSDFEPEPFAGKIGSDAESLIVRCRRTPKVIRSVRDWAPSIYLVGFKLLSRASCDELIGRADSACRINRADMTVANDLQSLHQGRHMVYLVRPGAEPETLEPGDDLADRLVARIITWASARRSASSTPAPSARGRDGH
jgi:phosphopantothenate-cysteine ligase